MEQLAQVVERPLSMGEVPGSIPGFSIFWNVFFFNLQCNISVGHYQYYSIMKRKFRNTYIYCNMFSSSMDLEKEDQDIPNILGAVSDSQCHHTQKKISWSFLSYSSYLLPHFGLCSHVVVTASDSNSDVHILEPCQEHLGSQ